MKATRSAPSPLEETPKQLWPGVWVADTTPPTMLLVQAEALRVRLSIVAQNSSPMETQQGRATTDFFGSAFLLPGATDVDTSPKKKRER